MIRGLIGAGAVSFLFGLPGASIFAVSNIPGYVSLMGTILAALIVVGFVAEKLRDLSEEKIVAKLSTPKAVPVELKRVA